MGEEIIQPDLPSENAFGLRTATKADLDAIFWIVQASFPDDPGCDYKFPYRDKYPDDFKKWTRLEYEEYLNQPEKFAVLVVTVPHAADKGAGGGVTDKPVAIGVWDMSVETEPMGGGMNLCLFVIQAVSSSVRSNQNSLDHGIHERCDANPKHMETYTETMSRGFDKYFAKYGKEQAHLWMLFTHPDFRRRGFGTMLCNWGQKEAMKKGWVLTVMASPMGRILYEYLGYKIVGSERVQVSGEDENVDIDCMMKENRQEAAA